MSSQYSSGPTGAQYVDEHGRPMTSEVGIRNGAETTSGPNGGQYVLPDGTAVDDRERPGYRAARAWHPDGTQTAISADGSEILVGPDGRIQGAADGGTVDAQGDGWRWLADGVHGFPELPVIPGLTAPAAGMPGAGGATADDLSAATGMTAAAAGIPGAAPDPMQAIMASVFGGLFD